VPRNWRLAAARRRFYKLWDEKARKKTALGFLMLKQPQNHGPFNKKYCFGFSFSEYSKVCPFLAEYWCGGQVNIKYEGKPINFTAEKHSHGTRLAMPESPHGDPDKCTCARLQSFPAVEAMRFLCPPLTVRRHHIRKARPAGK